MWELLTTWVRELVGGTISLTTNNVVTFCFQPPLVVGENLLYAKTYNPNLPYMHIV